MNYTKILPKGRRCLSGEEGATLRSGEGLRRFLKTCTPTSKNTKGHFRFLEKLMVCKTTIYFCFSLARTSVENEIEPFMMRRSDLLNRLTALALTLLSTLSNLPKCHLVIGIS